MAGVKRKLAKVKDASLTLEEAFEEYIDEKKAINRSAATIASLSCSFKRWNEFLIGMDDYDDKIENVTREYVYRFSSHLLEEELVKPTSVNHYLRDLRSFIYWCAEKNYFKRFPIAMVSEDESIKETYTDDEKLKLIAKPAQNASFVEWRTWAIVNWVLATGNRASTICEIQLGDISYSKQEIMIRRTKARKAYIIPLSPALSTVLREYVKRCRSESADTNYLFPNIGDEKLTVNALKHSLAKYNVDRDVNRTSIHALRHTFAKDWIRNTGDVFRLQKMLGHSTLEMTRRYVNMFSEDLKENFEAYNPLDHLKKTSSRTHKVIISREK